MSILSLSVVFVNFLVINGGDRIHIGAQLFRKHSACHQKSHTVLSAAQKFLKFLNRNNVLLQDPQNLIQNQQVALAGSHHFFCEIKAVADIDQFLLLLLLGKILKIGVRFLETKYLELRLHTF